MRKPPNFTARIPARPSSAPASPMPDAAKVESAAADAPPPNPSKPATPVEIGGPKGPDPTRFGDWEIGGRCIDF